jgi:enterochelin esterase-like enzyme
VASLARQHRGRFAGLQAQALLLATLLALPVAAALASTLEHRTFDSRTLGRTYAYTVYLPDAYADSGLVYPVLYLLHGSGGDETDWAVKGDLRATADRLIGAGRIPPAIIVMPGSRSWWVDGHNEAAKTAFFDDLIPHIEATFRTIEGRGGRLVAGLSAGGYGAINFALQHPDRFAAAAALSPASYVPLPPPNSSAWRHPAYLDAGGSFDEALWRRLNYPACLDAYKAQDVVVPVYINSGDHDEFDIAYHAAVLYQSLRAHQPDRVEFRVVDGDHEWAVWASTLPDALTYIFGFASAPVTLPSYLESAAAPPKRIGRAD